ncbi:MAG: LysR family transcriptional regulator [Pseudobutyrivibrio sp.]|nr:LysR family transcriptional regulator [Pseudobutyrivibrio sp.]
MHIEKLKYYIDLYECRNFTETAKKNFISQAALSQFISSLEKQFQLQFFNRNVTPIEPTTAGTLFYEESKILYKQYENVIEKMMRVRDDVMPPLKIAYSSTADIQALLPLIPVFKEKYPHAELQLNKIRLKETADYIEKGLCDIVVSFSTEFVENERVKYKVLCRGKYMAMVGKGHPLFEKESITTEELYSYPLIMLSKEEIGDLYQRMEKRAKQDGFLPMIEKTVEDIDTEMFSIITEGYIGFAPESQKLSDYGDAIRLIPIIGSSHEYIVAAGYAKDNMNQTLKEFIKCISNDI